MPIPLYSHCYTLHVSALRDGQHNVCPDANTWKSEHIYMEVKLTIKYNIKGVNTYNLKSLNTKI